jgi:hypothetical protein
VHRELPRVGHGHRQRADEQTAADHHSLRRDLYVLRLSGGFVCKYDWEKVRFFAPVNSMGTSTSSFFPAVQSVLVLEFRVILG